MNGLFDEKLVFHLTGDKVMGREALTTLCDLLRRMRHGQSTLVTRFEEEGDEECRSSSTSSEATRSPDTKSR